MAKEINELSDEELVEEIGKTPNVFKFRHCQAELTRRLMDELRKFNKSSSDYSKILLILTALLLVIGFSQAVIAIASSGGNLLANTIFIFLFTIMILIFWRRMYKKI
ncbi:hypothetical protein KJ853_03920 [Patescibacteria group bacterium]|nr:hypothetical protein [Patescibacteria group bacterium]